MEMHFRYANAIEFFGPAQWWVVSPRRIGGGFGGQSRPQQSTARVARTRKGRGRSVRARDPGGTAAPAQDSRGNRQFSHTRPVPAR